MNQMSDEMRQCIDNALACYSACMEAVSYGLDKGGDQAKPGHVTLLINCGEVCQTCAGLLLRGGSNAVCGACANLCEACARDCEQLNDNGLRNCIDACRRCAETCRKMAA